MKHTFSKASLLLTLVAGAGLFLSQEVSADAHVVQPGESFFSISQQYGMDPYALAQANNMGIFDVISPGQTLQVTNAYAAPAPTPAAQQPTATGTSYTVQDGDSFSSIALAYGIDSQTLASHNGYTLNDVLVSGQTLAIPGVAETSKSEASADNGYQLEGFDYEAGINYPIGQCTWGVQKTSGWAGDWWGNAADWARNAQADGYTIGTEPMVGAIAVWDDGAYGHVAYVTGVESANRIQVLEANYAGKQWIDNHRGWFDPTQSRQGKLSYIYPKY